MKEKKMYVIQNEDDKRYLSTIYVGKHSKVSPFSWAYTTKQAMHFENKEEAEATITFIGAVMDWELEKKLLIIEIQE